MAEEVANENVSELDQLRQELAEARELQAQMKAEDDEIARQKDEAIAAEAIKRDLAAVQADIQYRKQARELLAKARGETVEETTEAPAEQPKPQVVASPTPTAQTATAKLTQPPAAGTAAAE